jgi:hypothetical protein
MGRESSKPDQMFRLEFPVALENRTHQTKGIVYMVRVMAPIHTEPVCKSIVA